MWSGVRWWLHTNASRFSKVVQAGRVSTGVPLTENITQKVTTTTKDKELEKYISQAEAARIIGIARQTVASLVRRGCFNTRVVAGRILVLRSEAESFVPKSKGRPTSEMQAKAKPLKRPPDTYKRDPGKYVLQAEAARIRGVSQQAIANLINRSRLSAVSVAGRTLVLRSEVEAFVPQPVGHPPKKKPNTKTPQQKSKK